MEPETRADRIDRLSPWLLHWTIADERIEGFRSDSFAVRTADGLIAIDPVPVESRSRAELDDLSGIVLTHGNHQRAAWRFRRELGVPVYVPVGPASLDEVPDVRFDESTELPGRLRAMRATAFETACYVTFTRADGGSVLFCGDLICHDPGGPYRFPVQPGYFDAAAGRDDARRLLELPLSAMCAAHAEPSLYACREILEGAVARAE